MPSAFPALRGRPHADVVTTTVLPNQIYILDDLLSARDIAALRDWAAGLALEGPKPPGKGEAERTARRAALDSPEIATAMLSLLKPYFASLSPSPLAGQRPPALSPNIRVYHYPAGTYFRAHYDSPQLDLRSRRLSCWTVLVYLSSPVGGGTRFHVGTHDIGGGTKRSSKGVKGKNSSSNASDKREKMTIDAKEGRVLFHWHGLSGGGCLRHEGDDVVAGDKWVLRTDILA